MSYFPKVYIVKVDVTYDRQHLKVGTRILQCTPWQQMDNGHLAAKFSYSHRSTIILMSDEVKVKKGKYNYVLKMCKWNRSLKAAIIRRNIQ